MKYKMSLCFLHFFCAFFTVVYGQNKVLNLRRQLSVVKQDTAKMRLQNELAWELKLSNVAECKKLALSSLHIAKKYKNLEEQANAYKALGLAEILSKNSYLGIKYYDSGIAAAKLSGNANIHAAVLSKRAGACGDLGDFDKAIEYYTEAYNLVKKTNNKELLSALCNNLADAYQTTRRNPELIIEYFKQSIAISLELKQWQRAALSYSNLAREYMILNQPKEAEKAAYLSLSYCNQSSQNSYEKASTYNLIGSIFVDLNQVSKGIQFCKVSYRLFDSLNMEINWLGAILSLTEAYFKIKQYDSAKVFAQQMLAIAQEERAKYYIKDAFKYLFAISEKENNLQDALLYHQKYKQWSDSVYLLEKEINISNVALKEKIAKADFESKLDLQRKVRENKKLLGEKNNLTLVIVALAIILSALVLMAFLLYKNNVKRKKLYLELQERNEIVVKQSLANEVLIQEIHHRVKNNLTMLQSMLYLQSKGSTQEETKQVLKESQSRIYSISLVHQHLYENKEVGKLNLVSYTEKLIDEIIETLGMSDNSIETEVAGDELFLDIKYSIPIGLILNELIVNSFKYAFENQANKRIFIQIKKQSSTFEISCSDNGKGLPEAFETMTGKLGFKIIRLLVKQMKADINYHRQEGKSEFVISIPLL